MNVVRVYEVEIQEHTFRMSHEEVVALYAELAKLVGPPPGMPTYPPGVRGVASHKENIPESERMPIVTLLAEIREDRSRP